MDNTFAVAYGALGFLYAVEKQHDKALAFGEKAVALDPNSADAHIALSNVFVFAGKWDESIQEFKTVIRLNPIPPNRFLWSLGLSYGEVGKYEDAITWC